MVQLILARDAVTSSARSVLAHRANAGSLIRVTRGAYVAASDWTRLDATGRFRALVGAVVATASEPVVLCRAAAVVVWGLPWFGPWPRHVDVMVDPESALRSTGVLRRHREHGTTTAVVDGLRVTGLARTAVDVARESDFARAIVVADAALSRGADMSDEVAQVPLRHGSARARTVAAFADGRSASPGESVSRVTMRTIDVPAPVLQQRFARDQSGAWFVDFWWPDVGVIGEFDGDAKYLDARFRNGRSVEQVALDEKRREDALRRAVAGFARWDWPVARSPRLLAGRLALAGVRPRLQRTFL